MNLVHGSDGPDAAARELGIYFKSEELISYSASLDPWTCAGDEK
jgi:nucleoside-diphosphate kinase